MALLKALGLESRHHPLIYLHYNYHTNIDVNIWLKILFNPNSFDWKISFYDEHFLLKNIFYKHSQCP